MGNTEFRPSKDARDGKPRISIEELERLEPIPDGFYLVQDLTSPQPEWHKAMIDKVKTVTHIAPPDSNGKIIGEDITQDGVIGVPRNRDLGLCAGVTSAP